MALPGALELLHGVGSLAAATRRAREHRHKALFAVEQQVRGRATYHFSSAPSWQDAFEQGFPGDEPYEWRLHEIINPAVSNIHPFIDLEREYDHAPANEEAEVRRLAAAVGKAITQLAKGERRALYSLSRCSRVLPSGSYKLSYHIIYFDSVCANVGTMGAILDVAEQGGDFDRSLFTAIDRSVYKNNARLRTIYSIKTGAPMLEPLDDLPLEAYFVTTEVEGNWPPHQIHDLGVVKNDFVSRSLRLMGQGYCRVTPVAGTDQAINVHSSTSRYCKHTNHWHKSNGARIILHGTTAVMRCFGRTGCTITFAVSLKLSDLLPSELPDHLKPALAWAKKQEARVVQTDLLYPSQADRITSLEYAASMPDQRKAILDWARDHCFLALYFVGCRGHLKDVYNIPLLVGEKNHMERLSIRLGALSDQRAEEVLKDVVPEDGDFDDIYDPDRERLFPFARGDKLAIRAPMGIGKTHEIINLIRRELEADPDVTVALLCPRRSLGISLEQRLQEEGIHQAACYLRLNNEELNECQVLIISPESLHRLKHERKIDIVLLDEINALLESVRCKQTNHTRLTRNTKRLEELVRSADTVILLDAIMTKGTIDVSRRLVGEGLRTQLYLHDRHLHRLVLYLYEEAFIAKLDELLEAGQRIFLGTGSVEFFETKAKQIFLKYGIYPYEPGVREGRNTYLALTGSSPAADFSIPWSRVGHVITSPVCTVGVSVDDLDIIDTVMLYISIASCRLVNMLQMGSRVRNPTSKVMYAFINCPYPRSKDDWHKYVNVEARASFFYNQGRANRNMVVEQARADRPADGTLDSHFDTRLGIEVANAPSWAARLEAYSEIDEYCFKAFPYETAIVVLGSLAVPVTVITDKPDDTVGKEDETWWDDTELITAEQYEALERKVRDNTADAGDILQCRKYEVCRYFSCPERLVPPYDIGFRLYKELKGTWGKLETLAVLTQLQRHEVIAAFETRLRGIYVERWPRIISKVLILLDVLGHRPDILDKMKRGDMHSGIDETTWSTYPLRKKLAEAVERARQIDSRVPILIRSGRGVNRVSLYNCACKVLEWVSYGVYVYSPGDGQALVVQDQPFGADAAEFIQDPVKEAIPRYIKYTRTLV